MSKKAQICVMLSKTAVNELIADTSYKVQGGGILRVKSIFQNGSSYKDALYPAIINKLKEVHGHDGHNCSSL